ncbi:hypothetical protein AB0I93_00085 [Streptomyces sp. NPDC049967]
MNGLADAIRARYERQAAAPSRPDPLRDALAADIERHRAAHPIKEK